MTLTNHNSPETASEDTMTFEDFLNTLPALTGSDKQIEWGAKERAEALRKIWIDAEYRRESINNPAKSERIKEHSKPLLVRAEHLLNVLPQQTEAQFWINHRSSDNWNAF